MKLTKSKNNYTLEDYVFLFTTSHKNGFGGVKFMMTREDGMKFCSDDRTKGNGWAFFFTSIANYVEANAINGVINIGKKNNIDNGSMDDIIKDLGLTKINLDDATKILENFGIKVKR